MYQKERVDILYLVSHGFAARMILQTGLVEKLVHKGLNVAIGCSDVNDTNLKELSREKGVELYDLFSDFQFDRNGNLKLLRMYVLENVLENVALLEKHKKQISSKTRNPWKRIRPYLFYGIHRVVTFFPNLQLIYKKWEERKLVSKKLQQKLASINPRIIVSTYPVSFVEGRILLNAKQLGIKTVIHLLSWDNISCKGRFLSTADKYISWGPIMTSELQDYYNVDDKNIFETGVPHFDLHYQAKQRKVKPYLLSLGLDIQLPYIFFGMSSPYFAPNEIDIVEQLAKWVDEGHFDGSIQLVVRPHPQNISGNMADPSWLPRLKALKSKRVAVDFPDLHSSRIPWSMGKKDMPKLSTLLAHSVVSLNSGSTLSIDSLAVDTPVILTSFDGDEKKSYWESARRLIDFPHLKKMISFNGVSVIDSYDKLFNEINAYLNTPTKKEKEKFATLHKHCGLIDGESTNRVLNAITDTLSL